MADDWIMIDRLAAFGIVGLHDWERQRKQEILIDASLRIDLTAIGETDLVERGLNYADVAKELLLQAETAERHTIEALATDLAGICLDEHSVEAVVVKVAKPRADPRARVIAVEISRDAGDLMRKACIGIGSNEDAEKNLVRAAERIASIAKIVEVSTVYQTESVGASGRRDYLNAAVLIETSLPAHAVQRRLKAIEEDLGRTKEDKSVVPIDLDLCLLGDQVVRTGGVSIPDADIVQRRYLALTLSQLCPGLEHPETGEPLKSIAARLMNGVSMSERPDVRLIPDERDTGG